MLRTTRNPRSHLKALPVMSRIHSFASSIVVSRALRPPPSLKGLPKRLPRLPNLPQPNPHPALVVGHPDARCPRAGAIWSILRLTARFPASASLRFSHLLASQAAVTFARRLRPPNSPCARFLYERRAGGSEANHRLPTPIYSCHIYFC